jgi:hypothetical protein
MKVEVKESETEKELQFPCLMINAVEQVVLFHSYGSGTLLVDLVLKNSSEFGYHTSNWSQQDFKPFKGSIKLSND